MTISIHHFSWNSAILETGGMVPVLAVSYSQEAVLEAGLVMEPDAARCPFSSFLS